MQFGDAYFGDQGLPRRGGASFLTLWCTFEKSSQHPEGEGKGETCSIGVQSWHLPAPKCQLPDSFVFIRLTATHGWVPTFVHYISYFIALV